MYICIHSWVSALYNNGNGNRIQTTFTLLCAWIHSTTTRAPLKKKCAKCCSAPPSNCCCHCFCNGCYYRRRFEAWCGSFAVGYFVLCPFFTHLTAYLQCRSLATMSQAAQRTQKCLFQRAARTSARLPCIHPHLHTLSCTCVHFFNNIFSHPFLALEAALRFFLLFPTTTTNVALTPTAVTCYCTFGQLWCVFVSVFFQRCQTVAYFTVSAAYLVTGNTLDTWTPKTCKINNP